jgi:hypothetical protein
MCFSYLEADIKTPALSNASEAEALEPLAKCAYS